METSQRKPKVGVLAFTLDLYETLAPGLREAREKWLRENILPAFSPFADPLFERAVFKRDEIESVIRKFENDGADCLVLIFLTYSPSQVILPSLLRTRLPLLVWNTQELFAVDNNFGVKGMIDNHGVHGTQDLCNTLLRSGRKFEYVTSHLNDAAALQPLADFFKAAAAVNNLRNARIGLMGYPFPGMGDFALDTTFMTSTLGCQWLSLSIEDCISKFSKVAKGEADALVAEYRDKYKVAKDVTGADLESTARMEMAFRSIVAENKLNALTYQFTALGEDERTPTVPFVAASRLMADGIGFGGEGDIIAAAGTSLLNWLSAPATFSEIFTIDFAGNGLFMSHMGEINIAMARQDRKISLVARPSQITRTRGRQLALAATLEPGPATFFALTLGAGQRWRMITSSVNIADFGPLAMEVPHFKIVPDCDVRDFLTSYAKFGGPHHNAVCFGDARNLIRQAAALLDADYCEIS